MTHKILVVDDEQDYRDQLILCLSSEDLEVRTAGSGREAIDVGVRFRPDVVVADWMLKNHIHGLHVAEVLRTVSLETKTILITGFASRDLRQEAENTPVHDFIEKPFEPDRIREAVRSAVDTCGPQPERIRIGVIEISPDGILVYANWRAREMFGQTRAGRRPARLDDLFAPQDTPTLHEVEGRWTGVHPQGARPVTWRLRARQLPDANWLIVLLDDDQSYLESHPITRMLLEPATTPGRWPFAGHLLVVDGGELLRRLIVSQFQLVGCICHAAESQEEALRLFERDPDVTVVIVDFDIGQGDASPLVERMSTLRPEVMIVGNSGQDRRREFAAWGVKHFLLKPWRISDLINLLGS